MTSQTDCTALWDTVYCILTCRSSKYSTYSENVHTLHSTFTSAEIVVLYSEHSL